MPCTIVLEAEREADEGAETGYRVQTGPFPGWKDVPEW